MDHLFVGFAAAHDVLVEPSAYLCESEKLRFASDSVGPSWESYWYGGGLWAFPIDAATQVASYRHDLLHALSADVPVTFESVLILAKKARLSGKYVIAPACPTDVISIFFTLSANLGYPIRENQEMFVDASVASEVLDRLHSLIALAHPKSVDWRMMSSRKKTGSLESGWLLARWCSAWVGLDGSQQYPYFQLWI